MNNRLPKDAEIREAIARILASHSLDELTYERVYMLLEASFVCHLNEKSQQIKRQLDILLFKFLVDFAATASPNKHTVSPERPRERDADKQPIRKLLDHRLSDLRKRRSVDLSPVVESVVASTQDQRYPAAGLLLHWERVEEVASRPHTAMSCGPFWVSTGLYPQFIQLQLECPVCLERVQLEGFGAKRVRIECERLQRVPQGEDRTVQHGAVWGDSIGIEQELPPPEVGSDSEGRRWAGDRSGGTGWEALAMRVDDVKVDFVFTSRVLVTILAGYSDFCVLRRIRLFGIKIGLFGMTAKPD